MKINYTSDHMLKKEPKIIFHHIPKCGGTSIVTGLILTYYPWRFLKYRRKGFPAHLNSRAASVIAEQSGVNRYDFRRQLLSYFIEKSDIPFVSGHYPFDATLHKQYEEEWNHITLLRDPVVRWYSEYFWNRYKNHDYQKTKMTIEEYIESDQGVMNARSFTNFLSHSDQHNVMPTAPEVQEAIENLGKMRVVGCLENLENFRNDMKLAFGRKPIIFKRNNSPAPAEQKILPDENSDIHKKVLELTAGDNEIYQAAKRLSLHE